MQDKAILRNAAMSAQKVRLVANEIRGMKVEPALQKLTYIQKKASGMIKKVLDSAIANAEHNQGADIDELVVSKICIDEAPALKRFAARAKGRGTRILKRRCHILVEVADKIS